jgi:hypothetical protein
MRKLRVDRRVAVGLVICAVAAIASLWLKAQLPMITMYNAGHDDALQVQLASSMLNGDWLGQWTSLTLAKGIGYPLFLVAVKPLGLTPVVASQLVYLCGSALVALGLTLWTRRIALGTIAFVVLALSPSLFGTVASRIYRESLTPALAITILGLTLLATYVVARRSPTKRWAAVLVLNVVCLAVAIAWLSLTRADSIWAFGACALIAIFSPFFESAVRRERAIRLGILGGCGVVAMGAVWMSAHVVANVNDRHYGAAVLDDFSGGEFARTYKAWQAVEAGDPKEYVTITKAQRDAVYSVSPTARKLRPYLEVPPDTGWLQISCDVVGVCDEAGVWLPWMMRDAATSAFPISNEAQFQDVFKRIATEIEQGCSNGKLQCGRPAPAVAFPRLNQIDPRTLLDYVLSDVGSVLNNSEGVDPFGNPPPQSEPVSGETAQAWKRAVNGVPDRPMTNSWLSVTTVATPIVNVLGSVYRVLGWLLLIPALAGIVFGLFKAGRYRASALIAVAALAGFFVHATLIAAFGIASGPPAIDVIYLRESQPYLLLGLAIGSWLFATQLMDLIQRRKSSDEAAARTVGDADEPDAEHQQTLALER